MLYGYSPWLWEQENQGDAYLRDDDNAIWAADDGGDFRPVKDDCGHKRDAGKYVKPYHQKSYCCCYWRCCRWF